MKKFHNKEMKKYIHHGKLKSIITRKAGSYAQGREKDHPMHQGETMNRLLLVFKN